MTKNAGQLRGCAQSRSVASSRLRFLEDSVLGNEDDDRQNGVVPAALARGQQGKPEPFKMDLVCTSIEAEKHDDEPAAHDATPLQPGYCGGLSTVPMIMAMNKMKSTR